MLCRIHSELKHPNEANTVIMSVFICCFHSFARKLIHAVVTKFWFSLGLSVSEEGLMDVTLDTFWSNTIFCTRDTRSQRNPILFLRWTKTHAGGCFALEMTKNLIPSFLLSVTLYRNSNLSTKRLLMLN